MLTILNSSLLLIISGFEIYVATKYINRSCTNQDDKSYTPDVMLISGIMGVLLFLIIGKIKYRNINACWDDYILPVFTYTVGCSILYMFGWVFYTTDCHISNINHTFKVIGLCWLILRSIIMVICFIYCTIEHVQQIDIFDRSQLIQEVSDQKNYIIMDDIDDMKIQI